MKSLITLLCVLLVFASCSQSISPCHTYDKAYHQNFYKPKKVRVRWSRSSMDTFRI